MQPIESEQHHYLKAVVSETPLRMESKATIICVE
jgi:hypothetical protein